MADPRARPYGSVVVQAAFQKSYSRGLSCSRLFHWAPSTKACRVLGCWVDVYDSMARILAFILPFEACNKSHCPTRSSKPEALMPSVSPESRDESQGAWKMLRSFLSSWCLTAALGFRMYAGFVELHLASRLQGEEVLPLGRRLHATYRAQTTAQTDALNTPSRIFCRTDSRSSR